MLNSGPNVCPLCGRQSDNRAEMPTKVWIDCPTCGEYGLTESALLSLYNSRGTSVLYHLCSYTREQTIRRSAAKSLNLPKPRQAFVAMAFRPEMQQAFDNGLKVGIESAGYDAKRIDRVEHNNKIDDEIIAEIRASRFLVADFTLQRGGVYFEAGFALGLSMPVVWTCRKDDLVNAHFDTRQYNHIDWETPEDLAQRLRQRIEATLGRPA